MKTLNLVISVILLISISASAQKASFGLIGGGVVSGYYMPSDISASGYQSTLEPRGGFEAGIVSKIYAKKWLYFSPAIKFITKGGNTVTQNNRDVNDFSLKSYYITMPLQLVFKPVKWLNIEIGPEIGFLAGTSLNFLNQYRKDWNNMTSASNNSPNILSTSSSQSNDEVIINSLIEISAIVGISFDLTKNFNAGLSYSYAFNSNVGIPAVDNNGSSLGYQEIYNRNLSLTFRYYFINL